MHSNQRIKGLDPKARAIWKFWVWIEQVKQDLNIGKQPKTVFKKDRKTDMLVFQLFGRAVKLGTEGEKPLLYEANSERKSLEDTGVEVFAKLFST